MHVCAHCRPDLRHLPGLVVSHGICRLHALESLAAAGLLTILESIELKIRRGMRAVTP